MDNDDQHSDKNTKKTPLTSTGNSIGTSLTEPITDTIKRDLNVIVSKLKFFFSQADKNEANMSVEIRNYDLWGPFIFALLFAFCVTLHQKETMEKMFSIIIIYISSGVVLVTLNARLLKTTLTILQGGSVIGYSLFPMNIAAIFSGVFYFMPQFLKIAVTAISILCSIKCGFEIMKCIAVKEKIYLVSYPLVLFYLGLGCFLFSI